MVTIIATYNSASRSDTAFVLPIFVFGGVVVQATVIACRLINSEDNLQVVTVEMDKQKKALKMERAATPCV